MTASGMASYGAVSPELPPAGMLSGRMYRRNATVMACIAGALVLVVVAMSGLNRTAAPASLLQTEAQARYAAMQRVASAQAKVARDIAALRRTEAQTGIRPHSQQLKDFDYNMYDLTKYGPKAPADLREHRKGGLPLEDPENEFIHTPRIHHKHKFGPLVRDCPGGNCEHLDEHGVVTDRWPTDIYSSIPQPSWDPSADIEESKAINERTGEYERHLRKDSYHPPVFWGLGGLEGHGTMHPTDRGAEALEKAGVVHDRWPLDVFHAVPNPAWDQTEYDQDTHKYKMPPSTALDVVAANQKSQEPLEDAGVNVNRLPTDTEHRAYNQVDGLLDRLLPVEHTPTWRKGGVAPQEKPESFLLNDHPDLTAPQPKEDQELGYEERARAPGPEAQAHWGFWESIGCEPQGCFGKRTGQHR